MANRRTVVCRYRSPIGLLLATVGLLCSGTTHANTALDDSADRGAEVPLRTEFRHDVAPQLEIPEDEQMAYAARLENALKTAHITLTASQYILLVDRAATVQAALLFWLSVDQVLAFVGATPVSTGLPGRYEHFTTPLGVFDHSMTNPDFRAQGTKNKLGFRGYGEKGMRIYDFGWVRAARSWGDRREGVLRFQMHATDPILAAPRFGTPQSEGCVRIPALLNAFLDIHGLLDEEYERAVDEGGHLWVLRVDRVPTPTPGRYLVVVDSGRGVRPAWAPGPKRP